MMQERYRATPYGVRIDSLTPAGERLYSRYIPHSLEGAPQPGEATPWTRIVAAGLLVVQIGLLVVQVAMFEYVRVITDTLLAVA